MSLFVLVGLVTILTCDFMIALACTKWIERENYRTGTVLKCCAISCSPGFYVGMCTSNGTRDKCVPCPEGTYMEDPTNSFLPQRCISHECPPHSVPTDSFPLTGCRKKCRCDIIKGYVGSDPCNCQFKSNSLQGKTLKRTLHNEGVIDSNTSSTNRNLQRKSENKSLQTTTGRFLSHTTLQEEEKIYLKVDAEDKTIGILWTSLGIFLILILGIIANYYMKGKQNRKTLEPLSYKAPPNTERPQRPEARVLPFRNAGAVSSNEGSQPFLFPDDRNTYTGQSDLVEQTTRQTHSLAIQMQENVTDNQINLSSAPAIDFDSIQEEEDQSQSNNFVETVNLHSIHIENHYQPQNYYFPPSEEMANAPSM